MPPLQFLSDSDIWLLISYHINLCACRLLSMLQNSAAKDGGGATKNPLDAVDMKVHI